MSIRIAALMGIGIILTACAEVMSESVEATKAESQEAVISRTLESVSVSSPDNEIEMRVFTDGGHLKYAVNFSGEDVVGSSRLGLRFGEGFGPDQNIQILDIETSETDTNWEQPWGERRIVRDMHEELLIKARRAPEGSAPDIRFDLRVRVFNDGIGFRYEVPKQSSLPATISVMDELTEFNIGQETESWWIPSRMYNRYEYLYQNTRVAAIQEVHTPATFKKQNGTYLSIHEAALINYSGMSLEQEREGVLEASLAPRSDGKKVISSLPMKTPWRTIQIGDEAVDLINSDLILNLNEPNALGDVSYFEPGKYAGIWWDQHVRNGTWGAKQGDVEGLHAATTERTMKYMDFAAENGFVGVLVEGWNIGWDDDWFNNGDVRVIKSGYVADDGNIKRIDENDVPRYEYHDSQHQVDHHLKVVKRAHAHKIAMNPHEPVKDTGLRRTYPNWVSREGARGQEFNAWGVPPNGPDHVSNLIFTRMLSGPMDYTFRPFAMTFRAIIQSQELNIPSPKS